MKRLSFNKISGLYGSYSKDVENPMFIHVDLEKSSLLAVSTLKQQLTATNKSASFQLQKVTEELNKWKGFRQNSQLKEDRVEFLSSEMVRLKELVDVQYYDTSDGLSVPIGFWYLFDELPDELYLNTEIPPVFEPNYLRDYQREGIKELLKYKRSTIVLATGLGKSLIIASICASALKAGKRVCIIVPTEYLVGQVVNVVKTVTDSVCGVSSKRKFVPGSLVMVCTVGSANNCLDMADMLVADECIPYYQQILTSEGSLTIGSLYKRYEKGQTLPLAYSFNESLKIFEFKKILNIVKKQDREFLVRLKTSKLTHKMTSEHPVLTVDGWKKAEDIQNGDILIGPLSTRGKQRSDGIYWSEDQWQMILGSYLGDGSVQEVSINKYRLSIIHGMDQKDYLEWKKNILCVNKTQFIEKNGFSQKPAVRISTLCFNSKNIFTSNKSIPQWVIDQIDLRAIAIWYMDDGSLNKISPRITFHTESFDEESCLRIISKLNFFGIAAKLEKVKNRRLPGTFYNLISLNKENTLLFLDKIAPFISDTMRYKCNLPNIGQYKWDNSLPKFGTYVVTKTENIPYPKKDGLGYGIFDMEVEDNHNYVLGGSNAHNSRTVSGSGIVVHNCHHSAAKTWVDVNVAFKGEYTYCLTATPFRADGLDLGIHAFGGPVVYERDAKWGIENGWLAKPRFYLVNYTSTDASGRSVVLDSKLHSARAYNSLVCRDKFLRYLKDRVIGAIKQGKKVIVLFKTIKPGLKFQAICGKDLEFDVATSKFKKPIYDFSDNKTQILVSNDKLLSEGVDIKDSDVLFQIIQNKSDVTTYQAMGRVMRKKTGDNTCVVVDITLGGYNQFISAGLARKKIYQKLGQIIEKEIKE